MTSAAHASPQKTMYNGLMSRPTPLPPRCSRTYMVLNSRVRWAADLTPIGITLSHSVDPYRNHLPAMSMNAGRPKRHDDTTLIFETRFNDILVPESNPSTRLCVNKKRNQTAYTPKLDAPDYSHTLRFTLIVFHLCRATGVRNCGHPACIATMNDLKLVMPPCPTWTGLERWALQAAACSCLEHGDYLWHEMVGMDEKLLGLAPDKMCYSGKPATFADWARQVNHFEVATLLSWVYGLSLGKYWNLSTFMQGLAQFNKHRDRAINQAISRAHELHLCPHRIWAIAFSIPGQESNIPALVPHKYLSSSHKHDYCSTGLSHKNCTYDYCEISAVNFTNVKQCHRPACDGNCQNKKFPVHLLDKVANENRPTAWAIDGELRPLEAGGRYMTISHVWSDGTGGTGSVNECMYDFFCSVARQLECKGLWWDAICIPQDKRARAEAINHMHDYYSQAACTVVHDACLAMSEWVDGSHAAFALVMSNWFTRGWTALELSRSKRVEVLFSAKGHPGYSLKNLDTDIVSGPATVSSVSRQVASTAIESLRKKDQSEALHSISDVLTALGPRFTSWARDRAIIAGQFVGIQNLADDQHCIYQQVVCKIGRISPDQLFHHAACPTGPFAWLPSNLFDLPVSTDTGIEVEVLKDGSLLGEWYIIPLPADFQFSWDAIHPMLRGGVREALDDDKHIILTECFQTFLARGLVVKVMKDADPSYDILCRYVGPVYFEPVPSTRPPALSDYGYKTILINDSGTELDVGVSAVDHMKSLEP